MAGTRQQAVDLRSTNRVLVFRIDGEKQIVAPSTQLLQALTELNDLASVNGRLMLHDRVVNQRFQRLLDDVLKVDEHNRHLVGGFIKVPTAQPDSVILSVFPAPVAQPCTFITCNEAEIRLSCPRVTSMDTFSHAMRDLYALSASEARVVSQLIQGHSTREIAHNLKVADSTLRTHMKRIFCKTNTHHQAELVSKILLFDTQVLPDFSYS